MDADPSPADLVAAWIALDPSDTAANRELRRAIGLLADLDALAAGWLAVHGPDGCGCVFCRKTPADQTEWVVEQLAGVIWAVGHARSALDCVTVETPEEWAARSPADPPSAVVG